MSEKVQRLSFEQHNPFFLPDSGVGLLGKQVF